MPYVWASPHCIHCDAAVAAGLSGAGAAAAGDITAKASTSQKASANGAGPLEDGSKALTGEPIDKTYLAFRIFTATEVLGSKPEVCQALNYYSETWHILGHH